MKNLLIALIIIAFIGLLVYAGLMIYGGYVPHETNAWRPHHGVGLPGLGMGLVWLIVIVGLLYFLEIPHRLSNKSTSMATLDERYARGEIDSETYKRMKRTLEEQ